MGCGDSPCEQPCLECLCQICDLCHFKIIAFHVCMRCYCSSEEHTVGAALTSTQHFAWEDGDVFPQILDPDSSTALQNPPTFPGIRESAPKEQGYAKPSPQILSTLPSPAILSQLLTLSCVYVHPFHCHHTKLHNIPVTWRMNPLPP